VKPAKLIVRMESGDGSWSEAVFENPVMTATVGHSLQFAYQATYSVGFCTGVTVTGSSPEAAGYFKPALLEGQQQLRGDG